MTSAASVAFKANAAIAAGQAHVRPCSACFYSTGKLCVVNGEPIEAALMRKRWSGACGETGWLWRDRNVSPPERRADAPVALVRMPPAAGALAFLPYMPGGLNDTRSWSTSSLPHLTTLSVDQIDCAMDALLAAMLTSASVWLAIGLVARLAS